MSGMPGDVEEQPANRSAVVDGLVICIPVREGGRNGDLHSSTIATAMRNMRKWWYPIHGIIPSHYPSAIHSINTTGSPDGKREATVLTLHAYSEP